MDRLIELGGAKVFVLETVTGLVSEAERVKKALEDASPAAVTLPLPEEQLRCLLEIKRGNEPEEEYALSNYEKTYARHLGSFGEVSVPPREYVACLDYCMGEGVPLYAIDLDEDRFSYEYCRNISNRDLIKHSMRVKKLKRTRFSAEDPKSFALEWDAFVNSIDGFRKLDMVREEHMAREIVELSREYSEMVSVIEVQRADGIYGHLEEFTKGDRTA